MVIKAKIEPQTFIIFGATGNLASRKLIPALYNLSSKGILKGKGLILGVARRDLNDQSFRDQAREMLKKAGILVKDKEYVPWCESCLYYQSIGKGNPEEYKNLATRIERLEADNDIIGNRVFDIALPPAIVPSAIVGLGEAGLNKSIGWTRLVLEKPFGRDLSSAKKLNNLVHRYFIGLTIF
jgi:glucose-6-phosphate 1-dehydrogenase